MAIDVSSLTTVTDNTTGLSATTGVVSLVAGRLYECDVVATANAPGDRASPSDISGTDISFTLVNQVAVEADFTQLSLWRAMPSVSGSTSITITHPNSMDIILGAFREVTGMDTSGTNGSGAIVQSAVNSGSGTTLTVTLGAFSDVNNGTIAAHGWDSGSTSTPSTASPGTGFTETHDFGGTQGSGFACALENQWRADNDTSADVTWGTTGSIAGIGVEIKVAGAAPAATLTPPVGSLSMLGVGL